jgi:sulfhydrogenase subunit beta (sulfur reductase)
MKSFINKHQLDQIFSYISKEFEAFATQKIDGKIVFAKYEKGSVPIPTPKTVIPFKKILWPDGQNLNSPLEVKKLAFIGLTNCDAIALEKFLCQFSENNLLPKRENILIISTECQKDEFCFCTAFGFDKIQTFDLHIQREKDGYSIFSSSKIGEKILQENGVKQHLKIPKLRNIDLKFETIFNKKELSEAINDLPNFKNFWQGLSNNCFGCGSCSTVCPLCFCTKHHEKNQTDGSAETCLSWDSCFAKNFSEIQNHHDLRPESINRLYNWYHHKFVRAFAEKKEFLCTGCGRCIKACPAHLNQYKILSTMENQEERKINE